MTSLSPLSRPAEHMKRGRDRPTSPGVQGLCVHTTGSGIVDQALKAGVDPFEHAVAYYLKPESYFPHYVCGWDGRLVQICDELQVALHVGLSTAEAAAFRDGTWRTKIDPTRWDAAWAPKYPTPARLWLGSTPNRSYIGLECLPLPEGRRAGGLWFTPEQHEMSAELAADIFARHGLIAARRRICGHEDLNPLGRWDAGGGWDPGARRARPRWAWEPVLSRLGLTQPRSDV